MIKLSGRPDYFPIADFSDLERRILVELGLSGWPSEVVITCHRQGEHQIFWHDQDHLISELEKTVHLSGGNSFNFRIQDFLFALRANEEKYQGFLNGIRQEIQEAEAEQKQEYFKEYLRRELARQTQLRKFVSKAGEGKEKPLLIVLTNDSDICQLQKCAEILLEKFRVVTILSTPEDQWQNAGNEKDLHPVSWESGKRESSLVAQLREGVNPEFAEILKQGLFSETISQLLALLSPMGSIEPELVGQVRRRFMPMESIATEIAAVREGLGSALFPAVSYGLNPAKRPDLYARLTHIPEETRGELAVFLADVLAPRYTSSPDTGKEYQDTGHDPKIYAVEMLMLNSLCPNSVPSDVISMALQEIANMSQKIKGLESDSEEYQEILRFFKIVITILPQDERLREVFAFCYKAVAENILEKLEQRLLDGEINWVGAYREDVSGITFGRAVLISASTGEEAQEVSETLEAQERTRRREELIASDSTETWIMRYTDVIQSLIQIARNGGEDTSEFEEKFYSSSFMSQLPVS